MTSDVDDSRGTRHAAPSSRAATTAERRAARASVGAYHEAELATLIGHVRDGLVRYDTGEIDAFEFDELVHQYKRATQRLWSFCSGSGAHVETAARTIEWLREQGDLPDWWLAGEPRRRA